MEDLPFVRTQAAPSDLFSDTFVSADAGMVHYEQLRQKLMRAARAHADIYPVSVRSRLGTQRGEKEKVALPVLDDNMAQQMARGG